MTKKILNENIHLRNICQKFVQNKNLYNKQVFTYTCVEKICNIIFHLQLSQMNRYNKIQEIANSLLLKLLLSFTATMTCYTIPYIINKCKKPINLNL